MFENLTNDSLLTRFPLAPELASLRTIEGKYGKPVDVWAMGVVLYIL